MRLWPGAQRRRRCMNVPRSRRVHKSSRSNADSVSVKRMRLRSTTSCLRMAATGRFFPGSSKSQHCNQTPRNVPPSKTSGR
eukprot:1727747-Lingulodinium_polyedra.AAC.2